MSRSSAKHTTDALGTKLFGLWIENHRVQVAIAQPIEAPSNGRYRITVDSISCSSGKDWLRGDNLEEFAESIETLVDRYQMRRETVAVSLDGDICVSRITLGTTESVDRELLTLQSRVPRYLQLGPGQKVTGVLRERIDERTEYAVTSVANGSLIQIIYNTLRDCDVEIVWAEPSLVSVARLIGHSKTHSDQPVLIADGTGTRWDVGIVYDGRLILDYRPAAATSEEALRLALDGHISRLHRFCHRHLGIQAGTLNQLLVCGTIEKVDRVVGQFSSNAGLEAIAMQVPRIGSLYEISDHHRESHCVPAVASVLPLILQMKACEVPDLLTDVRRAPEMSFSSRLIRVGWPAMAAAVFLAVSFGLVRSARNESANMTRSTHEVKAKVIASKTRMAELAQKREYLVYLQQIEAFCEEPDWTLELQQITQSLPDSSKLNEFRVESGNEIRLDGTVTDEPMVYEILEELRQMQFVEEVALHSTTPESNTNSLRFEIRIKLRTKQAITKKETLGD